MTVTVTGGPAALLSPEVASVTDAGGNYSLIGLLRASYVVTPSLTGKVFDPTTRTIPDLNADVRTADFLAYNTGAVPRELRVVTTYGTPGQLITVPLVMTSQGTEALITASLNYDINPFSSSPTVSCGSSVPGCTITLNTSTPGKIGIRVVPAATLTAGPREIALVNFQSLTNTLSNTPISFGDTPFTRLTTDQGNNPLPTVYTGGLVVFSRGFEGDISTRNTGDGAVDTTDVTLIRQLITGPLVPDPAFNEYQRADVTPAGTKGDGSLDATDLVLERNNGVGIVARVSAGGPFGPIQQGPLAKLDRISTGGRTMRIGSAKITSGTSVSLPIDLESTGGEVASSFTINFDSAKLQNPVVTLALGSASGVTLTANNIDAAKGYIRVLVDSQNLLSNNLLNVTFDVAPSAPAGETVVSFGNDPTPSSISDAVGERLTANYEPGIVTISAANTAGLSVSGHVVTPDGRGVRNATVTITDTNGRTRAVTTSSFGYYSFDGVAAGRAYVIGVASRQYRFASRTVQVTDNLSDLDFVGLE